MSLISNMSVTSDPTNESRTSSALAALDGPSAFKKTSFFYPLDLGNSGDRLHAVQFFINVQQNSSYIQSNDYNIDPSTTGIANQNRAVGPTQLGSSSNALDVNVSLATGVGAVIGAAAGLAVAKGGSTKAKVAGAIVGGAIGAAGSGIAAEIIKQIDLTRKTKRIASTISLYMPDTLAFTYAHDYDQLSMTAALGKLGFALQTVQSLEDSASATILAQGAKFGIGSGPAGGKTAGNASVAETVGVAAEAKGVVGAGFTQVALYSAGYAQNPQFEMLYRSTNNRQFQFQFNFVPTSKEEAAAIQDIIKTFRFHAAPEIAPTAGGRYLVPPSEFDITFLYNGVENPNIPKISTCVLENIDLNFAAGGSWTAFDDGRPVEISMTLTFKEVEMIHKQLIQQGY
jgi:hypothetical protein